jgi:phosphatidylserine decarboxylase
MLSIRLTPANYHRVHFFDDGVITASKNLNGDLFSVNPLALKRIARLYCRNKRALTEFSSQNFGDAVLVEIGATFVGSIIHCFESGETVRRGQQASYFQPGGSLLLVFFKKNAFTPNECLLERTANGYETKVAVGEALGTGARRLS